MTKRFPVVFALYDNVTQLDFTGPYEVFQRLPGAEVILASAKGGDCVADGGITFTNVKKLSDIESCALICVPGGFGCVAAMQDEVFLHNLKRLAGGAEYVTSVCTGSMILGAAGLLKGKNAACHWAWRDTLSAFGAKPDPARVVRDGNVITGGGVTAGIDMALTVMKEIAGDDYAQTVQLAMEYAPAPPFNAGRPETAPAHIVAAATERLNAMRGMRDEAVAKAAAAM